MIPLRWSTIHKCLKLKFDRIRYLSCSIFIYLERRRLFISHIAFEIIFFVPTLTFFLLRIYSLISTSYMPFSLPNITPDLTPDLWHHFCSLPQQLTSNDRWVFPPIHCSFISWSPSELWTETIERLPLCEEALWEDESKDELDHLRVGCQIVLYCSCNCLKRS